MKREGSIMLRSVIALFAASALPLVAGCDATRRDPDSCWEHACAGGSVCNDQHRCVPVLDAAIDVRVHVDGGSIDGRVDLPAALDAHVDGAAVDVALDGEADMAMLDAAPEARIDVAVDRVVPDAPGTCSSDHDCPNAALPFCVGNACVACKSVAECGDGTPLCSASHACVSCAAVDAGCSAQVPACEADSGRCVECVLDGDCNSTPGRAFCVANKCAGCSAAAAGACAKHDPGKPACLATGVCVECTGNANCATPGKPICDTAANLCKPCATDSECESLPGPGACMADGHCASDDETVYAGTRGSSQCSDTSASAGSAATPFCTLPPAVAAAKMRVRSVLLASGPFAGGFTGISLATPLLVVGKKAVITADPDTDGIAITGGDLTLRGITVRGNANSATGTGVGIRAVAASGSALVLRMDTCAVTDHAGGGILLNGAAFAIRNTTISRNGPNPNVWGGISVENVPVAGPATLSLVTLSDNKRAGLACTATLPTTSTGSGVLATNNTGGVDISAMCGIASCSAAGPGCGAQGVP